MGWLRYANQGAIRSQPLAPKLIDAMSFLPDLGVEMEVFSGGQDAKGHGTRRTGSTRHDNGNAADVFFYKNGEKLDWANPAHQPIFKQVVQQGKARGVTGLGAGKGYMQPGSMHIGFGNPAIWGAKGSGENAAGWLREAYSGQTGPVRQESPHQGIADAAMTAIGKPPQGLLGSPVRTSTSGTTAGENTMTPFQPEPEERGLLFNMLGPKARGWATPERVARLQMALEGATLNPNQGVMKAAEATIQNSSDRKRANKTAAWLSKNGRDDLAQAVATGAIDARAAVTEAMKKQERAKPIEINGQLVDPETLQVVGDYRNPEKPATSDDIREFEYAKQQGYQGGLQDWMLAQRKAGASNTTINNGSEVGTIPQGYELFNDPDTGARRLRVLEGGPEDTKQSDDVAASNRDTATNIVTTAASRAREAAGNRDLGGLGTSLIGAVNPYSDSGEVMRQVEVLKSNAKIENLTAMRAASPTGGALGAVSDKESAMLAAKSGALDPNSPNFLRDLDDYERTLLRVVHGFEAGNRIFEETRQNAPAADGDGWQTINGVKIREKP